MVEELGVSQRSSLLFPLREPFGEGPSLEFSGLEFHAVLQQPCRLFSASLVWRPFKNAKPTQLQHSSFLLLSFPLWITEHSLIKGASPQWQQTVSKHKSVIADFMGFAFKFGFPWLPCWRWSVAQNQRSSRLPDSQEKRTTGSTIRCVHRAEALIRWPEAPQQLCGWQHRATNCWHYMSTAGYTGSMTAYPQPPQTVCWAWNENTHTHSVYGQHVQESQCVRVRGCLILINFKTHLYFLPCDYKFQNALLDVID